MIKIEKDIPVPAREYRGGRAPSEFRKTLDLLQVGESFVISSAEGKSKRGGLSKASKQTGKEFVTRKTPDGLRFWRIEPKEKS